MALKPAKVKNGGVKEKVFEIEKELNEYEKRFQALRRCL